MRRTDVLVSIARQIARTQTLSDGSASISDDLIIYYMNEGKNRITGLLSSLKNVQRPLVAYVEISLVGGQQAYTIPDRLAMNKHIHDVQYSTSGTTDDYVPLPKLQLFNQDPYSSNYAVGYFVASGQIYVVPPPVVSTGKIRVFYDRTPDDLDKRRGRITAVTGLTSTTFTSITIATTPDETSTPVNLTNSEYITVVDDQGTVQAYAIPFGSYVTATDVWTPRSGFSFTRPGDAIEVGDYVVFGKYSTTNCSLPDEIEPYLIQYSAACMLDQESSADIVTKTPHLQALENSILSQYKAQTAEVQNIPQFSWEGW